MNLLRENPRFGRRCERRCESTDPPRLEYEYGRVLSSLITAVTSLGLLDIPLVARTYPNETRTSHTGNYRRACSNRDWLVLLSCHNERQLISSN